MEKKNSNSKNESKIIAVGYVRYSSDLQREESIEAQERAIEEYCTREGIILLGYYEDRAVSAKK